MSRIVSKSNFVSKLRKSITDLFSEKIDYEKMSDKHRHRIKLDPRLNYAIDNFYESEIRGENISVCRWVGDRLNSATWTQLSEAEREVAISQVWEGAREFRDVVTNDRDRIVGFTLLG